MEYCFKSDVKPTDLWIISMRKVYRSHAGAVNILFTVAMVFLSIRFFGQLGAFVNAVLIFAVILFPILQPLAIYSRSVKQLENLPGEMTLHFDDKGLMVKCDGKSERIPWKRIANAYRQRGMVVVMSDDRHGYMLTDRVLGAQKEEFFDYLCSKING